MQRPCWRRCGTNTTSASMGKEQITTANFALDALYASLSAAAWDICLILRPCLALARSNQAFRRESSQAQATSNHHTW